MTPNLAPLTVEEIQEIQVSVVDKMIELNRKMRRDGKSKEAVEEISTLSKLSDKLSNYQEQIK